MLNECGKCISLIVAEQVELLKQILNKRYFKQWRKLTLVFWIFQTHLIKVCVKIVMLHSVAHLSFHCFIRLFCLFFIEEISTDAKDPKW